MLTVLAKVGNSAIVGQFALGLAITAPVFMFTNLQLRAVQATDARAEFGFADYFTLRAITTAIGFLVILALAIFVEHDKTTRAVILLVAVAKSAESFSDVIAGILQQAERLDRVAVSLIIRGLTSVAVFAFIFARFRSITAAAAGMALTWTAVLIAYDLPWARKLMPLGAPLFRSCIAVAKRLLVLTLPLGIVMTLTSLTINAPRYFLQFYLGPSEVGIYAALAYIIVAVNLIVNALGQAATTRLALMFCRGRFREFRTLVCRLGLFGALLVGIGVPLSLIFGRPVLTLLYRHEYGSYAGLLAFMVAVAGVNAIGFFATCGLNAARVFTLQVPIVGMSAACAIFGCYFLVPKYGLIGATSALAIATLANVAGNVLALHNVIRVGTSNPAEHEVHSFC